MKEDLLQVLQDDEPIVTQTDLATIFLDAVEILMMHLREIKTNSADHPSHIPLYWEMRELRKMLEEAKFAESAWSREAIARFAALKIIRLPKIDFEPEAYEALSDLKSKARKLLEKVQEEIELHL